MSRKFFVRIIPCLTVVPAIWPPPTIGIDHLDLNYLMGQQLGWLKWPTFLGLLFAAISFAISAFYIVRYTQKFYKERRIPKPWKFILCGIFVTTIAEIGEMLGFYEWPYSGMAEMTLLVWPHAIGGTLIGLGSYYLYREVR